MKKHLTGFIIGICLTITAGSVYMVFDIYKNLNAIENQIKTVQAEQNKQMQDVFKQIVEFINTKIPQG